MTLLRAAGRYWHTLRYLKPVQFYGRLWFRLARPRLDLSPPPPLRVADAAWVSPARREPSLTGPGAFHLLGVPGTLADVGWDGPTRDKLWRYHQHYFDDLNAVGGAERCVWHQALLRDWLAHHPPGRGNAWEPYPTSLRLVNWIKWALAGNPLPEPALHSLAVQARWLMKRLEIHLLGNHLFANAKALVFAGCFFQGPEAETWLRKGLGILAHEMPEQILPDGGHFERSPMYHALALEDVLDLLNLRNTYPSSSQWRRPAMASLPDPAGRMLAWLRALCHPDGEIAFFNDAAIGMAPSPLALRAYAARLGIAETPVEPGALPRVSRHLADSGYLRLEATDAVVLLDVAPIGPDYLPGHAHADTLAFELSLFGRRVIVNGGTSCYGTGAERLLERSTTSHSTVTVAGENSSEVWDGFRVARRAYPFDLTLDANPSRVRVACAHDGYRRLPGRPVHRRHWCLEQTRLRVNDTVSAKVDAVARFILHPAVRVEAVAHHRWRLHVPDGQAANLTVTQGQARLMPARYAPAFGQVLETTCLAVDLVDGTSSVELDWPARADHDTDLSAG